MLSYDLVWSTAFSDGGQDIHFQDGRWHRKLTSPCGWLRDHSNSSAPNSISEHGTTIHPFTRQNRSKIRSNTIQLISYQELLKEAEGNSSYLLRTIQSYMNWLLHAHVLTCVSSTLYSFSSSNMIFFLSLAHAKLIPASGPLHTLLPLPGAFFLRPHIALFSLVHKSQPTIHLLRMHFPDHLGQGASPYPL